MWVGMSVVRIKKIYVYKRNTKVYLFDKHIKLPFHIGIWYMKFTQKGML